MKAKLLCSYHLVLCRLENINLHLVQCFDHINHEHIQQFPPTHATESSNTSHALQRQDLLQSFRGIRKRPNYVRFDCFSPLPEEREVINITPSSQNEYINKISALQKYSS